MCIKFHAKVPSRDITNDDETFREGLLNSPEFGARNVDCRHTGSGDPLLIQSMAHELLLLLLRLMYGSRTSSSRLFYVCLTNFFFSFVLCMSHELLLLLLVCFMYVSRTSSSRSSYACLTNFFFSFVLCMSHELLLLPVCVMYISLTSSFSPSSYVCLTNFFFFSFVLCMFHELLLLLLRLMYVSLNFFFFSFVSCMSHRRHHIFQSRAYFSE